MWEEAGCAAWPIVSGGEAAIRTFLLDQFQSTAGTSGPANLAGVFGMLYLWLSASRLTKDPGPIRSILRDVIIEATPVTWVPNALNASRPIVAALLELQLLTRIQDHNVLKSKIRKAIDRRSIQALLRRIETEFPLVGETPELHVPLSKAAEKHMQLRKSYWNFCSQVTSKRGQIGGEGRVRCDPDIPARGPAGPRIPSARCFR